MSEQEHTHKEHEWKKMQLKHSTLPQIPRTGKYVQIQTELPTLPLFHAIFLLLFSLLILLPFNLLWISCVCVFLHSPHSHFIDSFAKIRFGSVFFYLFSRLYGTMYCTIVCLWIFNSKSSDIAEPERNGLRDFSWCCCCLRFFFFFVVIATVHSPYQSTIGCSWLMASIPDSTQELSTDND